MPQSSQQSKRFVSKECVIVKRLVGSIEIVGIGALKFVRLSPEFRKRGEDIWSDHGGEVR
jgi:hypothetical protein